MPSELLSKNENFDASGGKVMVIWLVCINVDNYYEFKVAFVANNFYKFFVGPFI